MNNWTSQARGMPFSNDTGETVPAFGCMGIESTSIEQGQIILAIRKPSAGDAAGGASKVVFNGETAVPDGQGGFAHLDSVVHALEASSITEGDECGPVEDEWELASTGSGFTKLATDADSDPDGIVVRANGGVGGDNCILIKTPGGGIPARTGTGPYTWGSATCTLVDESGVVGSGTQVVKNIVNQAIAANVVGKAERFGSIYVIDVASCS